MHIFKSMSKIFQRLFIIMTFFMVDYTFIKMYVCYKMKWEKSTYYRKSIQILFIYDIDSGLRRQVNIYMHIHNTQIYIHAIHK